MIEAGGGPCFTLKSRQGLAGIAVIIQPPFQRDDSPRGRVPRPINDAHAAATDFFQNTVIAQLPVAVGNIDSGEKRVEVLDVRFLRIKSAAQQTTYAEPRSDACERATSAARAILRGAFRQISVTGKIHNTIHCELASAAHK